MRRTAELLIAAAALVLAAGCSSSTGSTAAVSAHPSPSSTLNPATINTVTVNAMNAASTMRVSGSITAFSESFDLTMAKGRGVEGTVTADGETRHIVVVGDKQYIQLTPKLAAAYHAPSSVGKYVLMPASLSHSESLSSLLGYSSFLSLVLADMAHTSFKHTVTASTVGGVPCEHFDAGQAGTIDVAASGQPYILRMAAQGSGEIDYADWNQPVSISAPSPEQIAQLPG